LHFEVTWVYKYKIINSCLESRGRNILGGINLLGNGADQGKIFGVNSNRWLTNKGVFTLDPPGQFYLWKARSLEINHKSYRVASKKEIKKIN
jgi:hypothetical protein